MLTYPFYPLSKPVTPMVRCVRYVFCFPTVQAPLLAVPFRRSRTAKIITFREKMPSLP